MLFDTKLEEMINGLNHIFMFSADPPEMFDEISCKRTLNLDGKEAGKVKTTIIALSAAALIAAAPGVLAQNVSNKAPDQQHHASKKHPRVVSGYSPVHAKGMKTGYPGAASFAPSAPKDYTYENSRQAGGGGGGGGGM